MPISVIDETGAGPTTTSTAVASAGVDAGELNYRPLVQWPFLIVLWHKLSGERMAAM
jgi:hypothetical protein